MIHHKYGLVGMNSHFHSKHNPKEHKFRRGILLGMRHSKLFLSLGQRRLHLHTLQLSIARRPSQQELHISQKAGRTSGSHYVTAFRTVGLK